MKTYKQVFAVLAVGIFIAPQIAFAAWWNPISWGVWNIFRPTTKVQQIQIATTTPATPTATTTKKVETNAKQEKPKDNKDSLIGSLKKQVADLTQRVSEPKSETTKNIKVEQYIQQLIIIKNQIDELHTAELEVKKRMVDSEIKVSDFRIEKLKALADLSPLDIITMTYGELITIEEIRKKDTMFYLSDSLSDSYLYSEEVDKVIASLEKNDSADVFSDAQRAIDQYRSRFGTMKAKSEAAIESAIAENRAYAQEFLLRMASTSSIADRYASAVTALKAIEEAKQEIARLTTTTSHESYSIPTYFSTTEPKLSTGNLTCKYPTDKYILVPSKGWRAVKQCGDGTYIEAAKYVPNTSNMTLQQICDMRKSAWLSSGALVNTPDCSDLGL